MYTSAEYVQELVEDLISAAVDYGHDPNERTEAELADASESLYKTLEIFPNVNDRIVLSIGKH